MLLLIECVMFVWIVQECIVSNGEVGMFSLVGPCRWYISCNSQDLFHHRGHIRHRSIFLFSGTLGNIPFVFGQFKFYFALLYIFHIAYVLVIRGRFQFYKKHGEWEISSTYLWPCTLVSHFQFWFLGGWWSSAYF
jgi:hypothetical protein